MWSSVRIDSLKEEQRDKKRSAFCDTDIRFCTSKTPSKWSDHSTLMSFFFFFFAVLRLSPDDTQNGGPRRRLWAAIFSSFSGLVVGVLPRPFSWGRRRRSTGKRGREREREKDVTIFGRIFFVQNIIKSSSAFISRSSIIEEYLASIEERLSREEWWPSSR